MYRNWKKVSALGLAVLIGCMLPMSTMLAAEHDGETGQDTKVNVVLDNEVPDDADTPDDESNPDFENDLSQGAVQGAETDKDAGNVDDGNIDDTLHADDVDDGMEEIPAVGQKAPAKAAKTQESMNAPQIVIKRLGQDSTKYHFGGEIEFSYVNNWGPLFDVSASQDDHTVSLFYYLDNVNKEDKAKSEEQIKALSLVDWGEAQSSPISITPLHDGNYVIYVKAVGEDNQIAYAWAGAVVVDTQAPKVTELENGGNYPEGTVFWVEDDNLESVTINEQPAVSEADGSYKVVANGTSCVIKAKDKAGNSTNYSITIAGENPGEGNVISRSGTYSLEAGEAYQMTEGRWRVGGDRAVYRGGSTFYVRSAGNYTFVKY